LKKEILEIKMDEHSRNHEEDRRHYSDDHNNNNRGGEGEEENKPIRVVCIFGLHSQTTPKKIEDAFSKYGPLEKVNLIWDKERDRSKGYAFVYFDSVDSAINAKKDSENLVLDGQNIRIDFSKSEEAHRPTPGLYLGKDYNRYHSSRGRGDFRGYYDRRDDYRRDYRPRSPPRYERDHYYHRRSRSPPPPRGYDDRRGGYRPRSRSPPPPRGYDDRRGGYRRDRSPPRRDPYYPRSPPRRY